MELQKTFVSTHVRVVAGLDQWSWARSQRHQHSVKKCLLVVSMLLNGRVREQGNPVIQF